jgi:flagellar FliL protein
VRLQHFSCGVCGSLAQPLLESPQYLLIDGEFMAENDAQDAPEVEGGGKKSKKMLIILVAAAVIVIGAAAALFMIMSAPVSEEEEGAEPAAPTGPMVYLELNPAFIVSFPFQGRQRYLQASISVMSRDPGGLAAVTEHMPVIRHNLLNLLTAQMLGVAEAPDPGIERLRNLATEEVKSILRAEIGRDGIEQVLFTAFVLQ